MKITSVATLLLSSVTILGAVAAAGETPAVVGRLLPSKNGYERVEIKTDAAFWKKIAEVSGLGSISVKEKTLTVFHRREDDSDQERSKRRATAGSVIFTAARGMHGIIYMAVAVEQRTSEKSRSSGDFSLLGVEILKHNEAAGANVARESFLGRFRGRGLDGFSARESKADAVSGATISSQAVIEGIKKTLAIAEERFTKN